VSTAPDAASRTVRLVMFCHFIAAFAALGMPPYYALILQQSLHGEPGFLAGAFYVVPTLFTALSSPWWGRLADRCGKRALLLRAQLGLALSFVLASYAQDAGSFLAALVLQGLLGGTFAASNAYLAAVVSGAALTRSLTAMQGSARAALVLAPIVLGLTLDEQAPLRLYRWLAVLPLLAALLIARLPEPQAAAATTRAASAPGSAAPEASAQQIWWLQAVFVFATVASFPYFLPQLQQSHPALPLWAGGTLFALPHLVYLLAAPWLSRRLCRPRWLPVLAAAFALLALSLFGQWQAAGLTAFVAWRLLMGLAMTAGYIALHALIAGVVHAGNAGRSFGGFESSAKWGAVAAGLGAGAAATTLGLAAPLLAGALVLGVAAAVCARRATRARALSLAS